MHNQSWLVAIWVRYGCRIGAESLLNRPSSYTPTFLPAAVALLSSIVFGVFGQLLLKHAAGMPLQPYLPLLYALMGGIAVYLVGVASWMYALRHISLTVAYPLTSLNYVGILLGAQYWFDEQLSGTRIVGVALIFAGVLCVALGAKASPKRGGDADDGGPR